jgi:hypothetical protein
MKAFCTISAAVVVLVVPSQCFADWGIAAISKARANEMGVEVRSKAAGPNQVHVELEFKTEGKLKNIGRVDLGFGKGDNAALTVPVEVDRSKPGRVAICFTADRADLDKITLQAWVREDYLGGTIYQLQMKEYGEPVKGR